jgi:hypothetical protein
MADRLCCSPRNRNARHSHHVVTTERKVSGHTSYVISAVEISTTNDTKVHEGKANNSLLVPQRFDGIQIRGADRRQHPASDADQAENRG